jgi:hypothetical protein
LRRVPALAREIKGALKSTCVDEQRRKEPGCSRGLQGNAQGQDPAEEENDSPFDGLVGLCESEAAGKHQQDRAEDGAAHDRQKAEGRRGHHAGDDRRGDEELVPPWRSEAGLGNDHEVRIALQRLDAVAPDLDEQHVAGP